MFSSFVVFVFHTQLNLIHCRTVWLTVLGEVFIGVGIALSFIPSLPFVFKSVRFVSSLFNHTTSRRDFVELCVTLSSLCCRCVVLGCVELCCVVSDALFWVLLCCVGLCCI